MRGHAQIGPFLAAANEVFRTGRVTFAAAAILPGGGRVYEHVILRLRGARFARQVDVETWDLARPDPPTPVLNEHSSRQRIMAIPFPGHASAVCELTFTHRGV
jgi:hypothetical protein